MPEAIAGIRVPGSAIARAATQPVRDTGDDLLYNHSRRVFFWGALAAERRGLISIRNCSIWGPCSTT